MKQGYSLFRLSIIMLLSMLLLSQNSIGQIFYVKKDGNDAGAGTSWATAFRSIQKALAVATNPGTKIFVAAGTYFPDEGFNAVDNLRSSTFTLKNQVSLYGGFEPQFGIDDLNDTRVKRSRLSGDLLQDDFSNNLIDNTFHVVTAPPGVGNSTVIDGFTISDGNANGGGFNNNGGGMYNDGAGPTISNCSFFANSASTGGGIYNLGGQPVIINSGFTQNKAFFGGGIYNAQGIATISNCFFGNNTGSSTGGGIYNASSGSIITNCEFVANASQYGGGLYNSNSAVNITNCTIYGNNSTSSGGGIYNETNFANPAAPPKISNCIIWGNSTAIYNSITIPEVSYSIVQGGYTGTNNINQDPLFVNAGSGNLKLQASSPAANAGSNALFPGLTDNTKDLAGDKRVFGFVATNSIDIGAYELQQCAVSTWVIDYDNDGFYTGDPISSCASPGDGYKIKTTEQPGDCDDNDDRYHPGAYEECGGDYDCDGLEGICVECLSETGYLDDDGDGFGDPSKPLENYLCQVSTGYVDNNSDCNDADNTIYPGAPEICDGKDNDCDGIINEGATIIPGPDANGILYVKKGNTGGGSSWLCALGELADALKLAKTLNDATPGTVKQIWVAKGIYKPMYSPADDNFGNPADRDNAFLLVNDVKLYGGFDPDNGIDDLTDARLLPNAGAAATILSGDVNDNDISTGAGSSLSITNIQENNYHVMIGVGLNSNTLVDGFTFKGSNTFQTGLITVGAKSVYRIQGGGLHFNSSATTVNNCSFSGNYAVYGAGIFNEESSLSINHCRFTGNFANVGGGVFNSSGAPVITNSIFSGNNAGVRDGGIFIRIGTVTIINCTFNGNGKEAISGSANIYNSIIFGNEMGVVSVSPDNISHSLIQGLPGGSNNNLDGATNPLFADPANGNLQLLTCSPAIDAGSNSLFPNLDDNTEDLGGDKRVFGTLAANKIDMGAYEYQGLKPVPVISVQPLIMQGCSTGDIQPAYSESETTSGVDVFTNEINNGTIEFDCETASVTYKDVVSSTNNCPVIVTRTWTLTGTNGSSATADQTITIKDETAPTLKDNVTLPTGGININACAAPVGPSADDIKALYEDNCDGEVSVTKSGSPTGNSCNWSVTYTYEIKDACGNTVSPSPTITYTGGDKTPPTGSMEPVNAYLWPPNHKMRDISFRQLNFADNCGEAVNYTITSVNSNEPVSDGDGNTNPDWIISPDGKNLQLRAERSGTGTGRIYTITYKLTDNCGNNTWQTTNAFVSHDIKKPVIGASFKAGTVISLAGEFGDIAGRKHTAKWIIDGASITGAVTEPSAGKPGTVTGSWKAMAPGVYTVQLNITDQYGNTSYVNTNGDMQAVIVVYDPNGGYTFGQGTFKAPAGSVTSNPSATPLVTYGFQSNYFKKATNPKGETQLDFDAGDFRFNALNFDYLAVNGKNAQFKGSGKITNAAGETIQSGVYFTLTVQDNGDNITTSVDKIRMKIYNKNTGHVYFDNQMGAGDAALPAQAVNKGSTVGIVSSDMIVGGTNNLSSRSAPVNSNEKVEDISENLILYPNPARDQVTIKMRMADKTSSTAGIRLLGVNGMQVLTKTAAVQDGYLSATITLPAQLSNGVYNVVIAVENKLYHRKLLLRK